MTLSADQRIRLRQITEEYVAAHVRGEAPRLADLTAQHPDLAEDLAGFVVFYRTAEHTRIRPGDMIPTARELGAAQRALAARFGGAPALASLLEAGERAGLSPAQLAARLGVGRDVLGKLDRRLIPAASVPARRRF
ncbi:MAG: hypothetical protein NTZ05_07690 [Chloroflexi bacterium]|nr:hypothetical protein [Chloroflexota bacterium]